jgi:acyl-[acyl-carrier-protein]-phospholipid O-acyltransferase/long-chain-fatty-acid--[acyl-carrier-protein] ligase
MGWGVADRAGRLALRSLLRVLYRVRVVGAENVPSRGPALLLANHVSYLDPLLLKLCAPGGTRFVLSRDCVERLGAAARLLRPIVASGDNDDQVLAELLAELRAGGIVGLFPEGDITPTGHVLAFRSGWEAVAEAARASVTPVYLDGLSGAWWSYRDGHLVERPPRLRIPITIRFGRPLPPSVTATQVREAILELGAETAALRFGPRDRIERRFLSSAKRNWGRLGIADSTGRELSFGRCLVAAILLAGWLRRHARSEPMIGIMLPATAGAALANFGILLAGKAPVNLNFSAGREAVDAAIRQCGLKTILSSRAFLERTGLAPPAGTVLLEDVTAEFSALRKAAVALMARLAPCWALALRYAGRSVDDVATVVFSSGSTGEPKGVVLSHRNIVSNIESLRGIFRLQEDDRVIGVLPFFHVFGFTCTLCFPLMHGYPAVYHPNPTDARTIGELTARYRGTLLMATPTFFGHYLKRVEPEEFRTLRYVIAGGEKLPPALARAFQEKFGMPLLEGYGVTETSPVVTVNVPDLRPGERRTRTYKPGTVGRPIPGVAVRIVDASSGEPLPAGCEGLLLVKGPCCMVGYLNQPERTRDAFREGWYVTGDIASLDEEGFLSIADRLSRFSKIGGEMVPHVRIEQAVSEALDGAPCVVMATPDPMRGERLVVLYTRRDVAPAELWRRLQRTDLPKLWIPKKENFYLVEEMPPPLPSGKLDLRRLLALAMEVTRSREGPRT